MSLSSIIATIIWFLEKAAEAIAEWRRRDGASITGVGSVIDRVQAVVERQAAREDLKDLDSAAANAERRKAALDEMKVIGIDLPENDARWFLESALLRSRNKS